MVHSQVSDSQPDKRNTGTSKKDSYSVLGFTDIKAGVEEEMCYFLINTKYL
jgi:hypothetical protein